ncbi:YadA-like family protein [Enterobacter sp. RIT418]|uniref:YadA-like family protein n=1 Tax=Enterobacter sp. RIT418 TaxID=2202164 RepID=UPI0011BE6774|nr:YadA-like family protein [Enterobacter sp. RIT 418]
MSTTVVDHESQAAILSHSHSISTMQAHQESFEQSTNNHFASIEKQQDADRKEYRAGIAGVGAIAGLHYVEADNSVAIGAANFRDQQGYALGYRHKFSDNAAATISAAGTTNDDEVIAVSAAIGW